MASPSFHIFDKVTMMKLLNRPVVVWLVTCFGITFMPCYSYAFVTPALINAKERTLLKLQPQISTRSIITTKTATHPTRSRSIKLYSSPSNNNGDDDDVNFSRKVQLRAEAESPFVKVRFFAYVVAAGGSFTSLAISLARIAAALSGINADLMNESLFNAGIDLVVLAAVAFFYKNDMEAEQSRLKRASKGAEIAKLNVRVSKRALNGDLDPNDNSTFMTTLASLRRGRGIEKRVAIVAAGLDKIKQVVADVNEMDDDLDLNDLLIVPLVLPNISTPDESSSTSTTPKSLALPVLVGEGWKEFIKEEVEEANSQGVDVQSDGLCIILKKNGRVGQRTKGINLESLVGNVVSRREAGMDVTNI